MSTTADYANLVLKMAKRWQLIADEVRPLPGGENVGRALLAEEKLKLLRTAASKSEWDVARLAMILALNTTMRGCELRALRWRDVDFLERTVTVRRSKTETGKRLIPLNANAWDAILELRDRSKRQFGDSLSPDWHLFPHAEGFSRPDPTQPMWRGGWRTAWRNITREAGLKGLRFHDLRHHAITELAESDASDQTIRSIAGHVSEKMLGHYSHIRLEAKRRALDALSGRRADVSSVGDAAGGYGTSNVTNPVSKPNSNPQVIEKNGGADGIRTHDLLDAIEARSQLRHGPTV
jgi:integrase